MQVVQTFWSGPAVTNTDTVLGAKAGWLSCEYHWMSWALSCLQAKNVLGAVNLVTDNAGKEILIEQLQLPYATVSTGLQGKLDQYPASLWALAKIYTYSIQTSPFLHMDGDVYLWEKPSHKLLSGQLIAQNQDKNLPFYADILYAINQHLGFVPGLFSRERFENKDLYASNAGLLGGSNLLFFEEYCRQAFEFIDRNRSDLSKVNSGSLNFIFEQYLFCQLAAERNIPVNYFKGVVDNPVFKDFIRFEDFPNLQMIHPVGGFKQYPHVCDHLAKKLRKDYPEYYYRIIAMLKDKGVKIRSGIYTLPGSPYYTSATPKVSSISFPLGGPALIRTQAVIAYLNKTHFKGREIVIDDHITREEINEKIIPQINKATDRKRLLEIYNLEMKRVALLKTTYKNESAINNLYATGVKAYEQIQSTFALPRTQVLKTAVTVQNGYIQLKAGWDWKYDYLKDIPTIVERNFNQKKVPQNVILLPDILQAGVKEYYPDELDHILFETLKTPFTIQSLLTWMKQYFSDEEINDDCMAFENLVINTVKRLLYYGLLKINLH